MADVDTSAVPWYRSPVMVSQVVGFLSAFCAIAPKAAATLGLSSPQMINDAVTTIFGVIAVLAPAYGAIKRARSKFQPLTLTKTGAESHPQTVANAAPKKGP